MTLASFAGVLKNNHLNAQLMLTGEISYCFFIVLFEVRENVLVRLSRGYGASSTQGPKERVHGSAKDHFLHLLYSKPAS